jgi:two-component sensor histidine kinase
VRFSAELPPEAGSPHRARLLIRERLADTLPAIVLYDLLTVVTELVTNAVVHGEPEPIELTIELAGDGVVLGEVVSCGGGPVELGLVDSRRPSGLGLHMVDTLAERWEAAGEGETRISFALAPAQ